MSGERPESACPGLCCAAFYWPRTLTEMRKWPELSFDGEQIRDMLIPLTPKEANDRYAHFSSGRKSKFKWKNRGHHFTCKNWDEDTRLCRIYEDRPTMCRDYPYGQECQHGCGMVCGIPTSERAKIREEQIGNQWKAYEAPNPPEKLA